MSTRLLSTVARLLVARDEGPRTGEAVTAGTGGEDTLLSVLADRAVRWCDLVALTEKGGGFTYGQLEHRSDRVAAALTAAGVREGARVAMLSKNTGAQLEIWWGAMKRGAALVPLNYRLVARELIAILNDAEAEVLFVGHEFDAVVEGMVAQLPALRHVIALEPGHARWPGFAQWRDTAPAQPPHASVGPSHVALQIYTSGTTGRAKGVQLTHANLIADQHRSEALGMWSDRDVLLLCMPLCHLGGCGQSVRCIWFGMRMVLQEHFDPAQVLQAITEHRVTKTALVPSMLHILMETPACRETDLSSLDMIFYGAGAMSYELLTQAMKTFSCRFATSYGLTESGGSLTALSPQDHLGPEAPRRMRSCGRASGAEIRIVDEAGNTLPAGTVGEIIARSPQVMAGYFRQPEETRAAIRDGWLFTGDAGFLDEEGYLYICDRIKDMIVTGGLNVYPREVEDALLEHPAVLEAAVIGVPHERWREAVKAIVVLRPDHAAAQEELIAFARERVAKYKVPHSVDFADALPRNASGKVLKRELRLPYWSGHDRLV